MAQMMAQMMAQLMAQMDAIVRDISIKAAQINGGRLNQRCPQVPGGGPGKGALDRIVKEARHIGRVHNPDVGLEGFGAMSILAENSKTGGRWDIKNLRDTSGAKLYPNGQNYGNFLYGATSVAMGFSPGFSDFGADLYSLWDHGTLEDQDAMIRAGQRYAAMGCDGK